MKKIPWAIPDIGEDEFNEVKKLFDINWLSMGPQTAKFEEAMKAYVNRKYALAVNNGTTALDIAFKVLGIKPGDEIILPAMTYIATGSMVLNQGAVPVYADIDRYTFTIMLEAIEKCITSKTKAVLTMDYGGNSCDYDIIEKICRKHGLYLIVDAAQSLGGYYKNKPLGSFGDIATMSFHSAKVMTTIEGGMIFTDNDNYAEKIMIMRNQGEDPREKYKHIMLGYNARLTDMQAAIGLAQFSKIKKYLTRRAEIAQKYIKAFSQTGKIQTIKIEKDNKMAWFLFPILVENRDEIDKKINEFGVDTRRCYHLPLYKHPMFSEYSDAYCENAEYISARVINLPIFPKLTDKNIDFIIEAVANAIK